MLFYDDNNLEKYDGRKIIERFKNPKKQSSLVKSIIRGKIKNLIIPTTHIMGINIDYYCNPNGKRIYPKTFYVIPFQKDYTIFIKHFSTKTAEEFCIKLKKKGDAQFNKGQFQYEEIINRKIDIFFSINKITIQKIKILEDCLGINLTKYRKYYKNNILILNYTF